MSYRCVNPNCFQGNPGDPPEYGASNPFTCLLCGEERDLDDDSSQETPEGYVCRDCWTWCSNCGDSLAECLDLCEYCFAMELCGGLEV